MNIAYLSKFFKSYMDVIPLEYMEQIQLAQMKKPVTQGHLTIKKLVLSYLALYSTQTLFFPLFLALYKALSAP